ncbi:CaiB/BaiF CoA transferase family protein [Aquabacter cavernae]|uniref:CaiB/BaiF CoA transferase family protein n=1 Tax=Aquabacter cavernae TaxID=2496029 RepID=UPI000F8E4E18|nr:CoA transferase [Aquabacter cavernae]
MYGVLNGVRIVEQGTFITGPCAGMMLADLGADVIKVESAGNGDPYRSFKTGFYSAHFQAYNRNKRSICLDMKASDDQEVFYDLIRQADVYIQNFRPGAAARIGADVETLHKINPRLIYCSISGFGPDGPDAKRPVYDSVAQAVSGFLGVAIDPEQPRFIGPALADAITGIYASLGIAGALVERGRTGKGRLVEISMLEAMMHFAVEPFMGYFALGELPTGVDRPRLAQAYIVRCRDGKLFAFHLSSLDKFWDALVEATGAHHLAADPRFAIRQKRIDNYLDLSDALNELFGTRDRKDWVERFSKFDVPFAPINSIPEVVDDPQVSHLGMIVPVKERSEGASLSVRPAFSFDRQRADAVKAAPTVNEDGDTIRKALVRDRDAWPERRQADPIMEKQHDRAISL